MKSKFSKRGGEGGEGDVCGCKDDLVYALNICLKVLIIG